MTREDSTINKPYIGEMTLGVIDPLRKVGCGDTETYSGLNSGFMVGNKRENSIDQQTGHK